MFTDLVRRRIIRIILGVQPSLLLYPVLNEAGHPLLSVIGGGFGVVSQKLAITGRIETRVKRPFVHIGHWLAGKFDATRH